METQHQSAPVILELTGDELEELIGQLDMAIEEVEDSRMAAVDFDPAGSPEELLEIIDGYDQSIRTLQKIRRQLNEYTG